MLLFPPLHGKKFALLYPRRITEGFSATVRCKRANRLCMRALKIQPTAGWPAHLKNQLENRSNMHIFAKTTALQ
jgi:hypothetical protein